VKPSLVKYAAALPPALTGTVITAPFTSISLATMWTLPSSAIDCDPRAVEAFGSGAEYSQFSLRPSTGCARLPRHFRKTGGGLPVFTSEEHDMYQMVSILRAGHMMVCLASRHRHVDAALVPSAGITMDEISLTNDKTT